MMCRAGTCIVCHKNSRPTDMRLLPGHLSAHQNQSSLWPSVDRHANRTHLINSIFVKCALFAACNRLFLGSHSSSILHRTPVTTEAKQSRVKETGQCTCAVFARNTVPVPSRTALPTRDTAPPLCTPTSFTSIANKLVPVKRSAPK